MSWNPRSHKKSHAWMQQHVRDPWVQKAHKEGWRSRAVFKLAEIDQKDKLLEPGLTVVDLGASPGSWCQYAWRRIQPGGRLLALDLLPMAPLAGVEFIQGDLQDEDVWQRLADALAGQKIDLVLSDMAPNLTGVAATDHARIAQLNELALDFALAWLKPGGDLLVKVFHGAAFDALRRTMAEHFRSVAVRKPTASRERSAEVYLLARHLREARAAAPIDAATRGQ